MTPEGCAHALVMVGQWRKLYDGRYIDWIYVEYGLYADRSRVFRLFEPWRVETLT